MKYFLGSIWDLVPSICHQLGSNKLIRIQKKNISSRFSRRPPSPALHMHHQWYHRNGCKSQIVVPHFSVQQHTCVYTSLLNITALVVSGHLKLSVSKTEVIVSSKHFSLGIPHCPGQKLQFSQLFSLLHFHIRSKIKSCLTYLLIIFQIFLCPSNPTTVLFQFALVTQLGCQNCLLTCFPPTFSPGHSLQWSSRAWMCY